MSGVKSATVRNNLNRTMNVVRQGLAQCEQVAAAASDVGRAQYDRQHRTSEQVHRGLSRTLPADLQGFLKGETRQWEALLRNHDRVFQDAEHVAKEAANQEKAFKNCKTSCDRTLDRIESRVAQLRASIQTRDWYLDAENEEAKSLRREAESALYEIRGQLPLAHQAQALRRESFTKLAEADRLAQAAQREYDRLVGLGRDRKEQQRIKAENQRKAMELNSDLTSLRRKLEGLNWAKFSKGMYSDSVRRELDEVGRQIGNGKYESAISAATALKARLEQTIEATEREQRDWEAAKTAAEKALADAREECGKMNRADIATYGGRPAAEVSRWFAELESAATDLRNENFACGLRRIAGAVENLRKLNDQSMENKKLSERRMEMAQSIMQALYDSNYDTPNYRLDVSGDELSDLHVVAAAPGGVGDMKMRIDLSGNVKFEVMNIPKGQESLCVDKINELQERLSEDEIRFDMTDWGERVGHERPESVVAQILQPQKQDQVQIQTQG